MEEQLFKNGDTVPKPGKYECTVCGFIVEYLPKHLEHGATFPECAVCKAGTSEGSKKEDEDFWKFIG